MNEIEMIDIDAALEKLYKDNEVSKEDLYAAVDRYVEILAELTEATTKATEALKALGISCAGMKQNAKR